jgi:hypothetical protein
MKTKEELNTNATKATPFFVMGEYINDARARFDFPGYAIQVRMFF